MRRRQKPVPWAWEERDDRDGARASAGGSSAKWSCGAVRDAAAGYSYQTRLELQSSARALQHRDGGRPYQIQYRALPASSTRHFSPLEPLLAASS